MKFSGGKLIAILACIISLNACSQKPTKDQQPVTPAPVTEVPAMPILKEPTKGKAVIECHTQEELNAAIANNAYVVVDFHGEAWCGPCRAMNPVVKKLASEMADVTFVKVNVDEFEPAGIKGVPTFVFYKNGTEIKGTRVVGSQAEQLFRQHIMKVFGLPVAQPA